MDAIIVPTVRSADQLSTAANLAGQLRCPLIAIYSRRTTEELSRIKAELRCPDVTIVGLPANMPDTLRNLLAFDTESHPEGVSSCPLDISRKRNIGLLLAQMCGWTGILFLDDDIRNLSAERLVHAATLLRRYPVVGFRVRSYPDNSVAGHAKRLAGWAQDVFISGGSLLVDPGRLEGFFPPVYHEDWLCVFNRICTAEVAVAGEAEQEVYAPFATPLRAWLEEFGDILGEGLLWLAHRHPGPTGPSFWDEALDVSFWRAALRRRATLLDEVTSRLRAYPQDGDVAAALVSLKQAQIRHSELAAEDFVSFVHQWRGDLVRWRERLSYLPRVDSVGKALAELGLSPAACGRGAESPQVAAAAERFAWPAPARGGAGGAARSSVSGSGRRLWSRLTQPVR